MNKQQPPSDNDRFREWIDDNRDYLSASNDLAHAFARSFVIPRLQARLVAECDRIYDFHRVTDDTRATHYTSISTLVRMVGSHLRLYDTFHLNDPMEGKRFVEALQRKHAWLGEARSHAYIASFVLSDDGRDRSDKLTFWRTYGSDGKGCSVTLKRMPTPVYRVRYGEGAFEDAHCRIDPVLAALEPVLEMLNDDSQEARWLRHSLVTTIWRALGGIPYLYKDDAYTDEHECRVVVPAHTLSREDQRNIVIEPYPTKPNGKWRHYYKDDALAAEKIFDSDCTIVLGPAVRYRDNVAYCLERMLRDGQGYGANVVVSTIPYRSQNEHE